nr:hypothetical protein [Rhodococcus opacus]
MLLGKDSPTSWISAVWLHAEFVSMTIGTQSEKTRVPLLTVPSLPHRDGRTTNLIPSLLAASMCSAPGWFAAEAAKVGPERPLPSLAPAL